MSATRINLSLRNQLTFNGVSHSDEPSLGVRRASASRRRTAARRAVVRVKELHFAELWVKETFDVFVIARHFIGKLKKSEPI